MIGWEVVIEAMMGMEDSRSRESVRTTVGKKLVILALDTMPVRSSINNHILTSASASVNPWKKLWFIPSPV